MNRIICHLARCVLLAGVVCAAAGSAAAQSQGTVTINGSVGNAASLRWWSFTNNNAASGANAPATQNSPLSFTLDLGDVSPANSNACVGGTVQLILRTNAAYTLSAALTASSGFGASGDPAADVDLDDIGFGIPESQLSASGARVTATAVSGSAVDAPFDNEPCSAPRTDDIPTFPSSLGSLATTTPGTQVLAGPRVSNGGTINSPNNGLLVNTLYGMAPQFFTPATFSATVTYTLATP